MERFYFILAIAAILLAGDLVWWEAKKTTDDLEAQTAVIYTVVSNPDKRELLTIDRQLEAAERELERLMSEEPSQE